jgi:hypothetical protein
MSDEEIIKAERAEKEAKEAKELMDKLSDYVNYRKPNKAFIEAFKREHRTLQQSMFRMFLELMEDMALGSYPTDGRNEQSKAIASQLVEGFREVKKKEFTDTGYPEHRAEEYVRTEGGKPSRYLGHI